jgi:hypothetical protein
MSVVSQRSDGFDRMLEGMVLSSTSLVAGEILTSNTADASLLDITS